MSDERCPGCAGPMIADDAGPDWVDFCCVDCGRVSREAVVEP